MILKIGKFEVVGGCSFSQMENNLVQCSLVIVLGSRHMVFPPYYIMEKLRASCLLPTPSVF